MENSASLLNYKEVCKKIGFKKSWLWKSIKEGAFPEPIRIITPGSSRESCRWPRK
jgi:predicted DNA-binding transcriptional regulator AlpA